MLHRGQGQGSVTCRPAGPLGTPGAERSKASRYSQGTRAGLAAPCHCTIAQRCTCCCGRSMSPHMQGKRAGKHGPETSLRPTNREAGLAWRPAGPAEGMRLQSAWLPGGGALRLHCRWCGAGNLLPSGRLALATCFPAFTGSSHPSAFHERLVLTRGGDSR